MKEDVVDGKKTAMVKYSPGDDMKRVKTATTWSKDAALQNGSTVTASDIACVLQFAEIQAAEAFNLEGTDDVCDVGDVSEERANLVDRDIIAELAWNADQHRPDFIIYDRNSHAIERSHNVAVGGLKVIPPTCWR